MRRWEVKALILEYLELKQASQEERKSITAQKRDSESEGIQTIKITV